MICIETVRENWTRRRPGASGQPKANPIFVKTLKELKEAVSANKKLVN